MVFLRPTVLIFFSLTSVFSLNHYYWREYTGHVPSDAVVVGKDLTGNDMYVGQGYVRNFGWQVVPIYNGTKEVFAVFIGVRKIEKYIKILCGDQKNFHWARTDHQNFEKDLRDKEGVVGGHEDDSGNLFIGRIQYEGETKIGKVLAYRPKDARFHYADKGAEKRLDFSYEVLYFEENGFQPRLRN